MRDYCKDLLLPVERSLGRQPSMACRSCQEDALIKNGMGGARGWWPGYLSCFSIARRDE